ncbi:MAG: GTPase ObgE, partial [Marinoscillum sp.]
GGDGGRGGNIILKGNKQLWTLLHLKFTKHVIAENGGDGSGSNKYGSNGKDTIIEIPLGTIVKSSENSKKKLEILNHNEEKILLKGGIGGLGNDHFKSPTNQAPQYSQTGKVGIEEWVILELKVLADVGLVGFPNAGKSTLLSSISKAKPKIGNYPFTTLTPNLGVVPYKDYKSFIVADIPGIIEGASEGKGLGIRFLRHIERNSILLFLIPFDSNIKNEYKLLSNELKKYNKKLLEKKMIIAISKCDLAPKKKIDKITFKSKYPVIKISSITNLGLMELKDCIWKEINSK